MYENFISMDRNHWGIPVEDFDPGLLSEHTSLVHDEVLDIAAIIATGCSLEGKLEEYQEGSVYHHHMEGSGLIDTFKLAEAAEDSITLLYLSNMALLRPMDIAHTGTRLVSVRLRTTTWQSLIHRKS